MSINGVKSGYQTIVHNAISKGKNLLKVKRLIKTKCLINILNSDISDADSEDINIWKEKLELSEKFETLLWCCTNVIFVYIV